MKKISQKRLAVEVILDLHRKLAFLSKKDISTQCGSRGWFGVNFHVVAGRGIVIPSTADYKCPKATWLMGAARTIYRHCKRMGLQPRLLPVANPEFEYAPDIQVKGWKFAGFYYLVLDEVDHYSFAKCWAKRRKSDNAKRYRASAGGIESGKGKRGKEKTARSGKAEARKTKEGQSRGS